MLLWHMDCYANARKGESWGNFVRSSWFSLASHAGSTERARRQFGVAWPDLTELVSGGAGGTHASGRTTPAEIGQEEKHTELVCGRRRWMLVSVSQASTRHLHELDYRQTAFVEQLIRMIDSSICSSTDIVSQAICRSRKHSVRFLLEENSRRETHQLLQITWNSILNFQVQFQHALFNN